MKRPPFAAETHTGRSGAARGDRCSTAGAHTPPARDSGHHPSAAVLSAQKRFMVRYLTAAPRSTRIMARSTHLLHRQQAARRGAQAEVDVLSAAGAREARVEALARVAHRHVGRHRPGQLRGKVSRPIIGAVSTHVAMGPWGCSWWWKGRAASARGDVRTQMGLYAAPPARQTAAQHAASGVSVGAGAPHGLT